MSECCIPGAVGVMLRAANKTRPEPTSARETRKISKWISECAHANLKTASRRHCLFSVGGLLHGLHASFPRRNGHPRRYDDRLLSLQLELLVDSPRADHARRQHVRNELRTVPGDLEPCPAYPCPVLVSAVGCD